MKNSTTLLIGLFYTITAFCQDGEFKVHPNGLIYSEQTMGKLSHIVDSLNLKYKTCNFNTVFYAKSQTIGHLVEVDKDNCKEAMKDIEANISFDDFIKKYPSATIERNVLIIKSQIKNYDNKNSIEFEHFDLKNDYGFSIHSEDVALYQKDFSNKWLIKYTKKTKYSEESLSAFFFPENFSSVAIPQKYAQMIGYSDCLIDTTTTKFKDNLKNGWVELPKNWTSLSDKKKAKLLDEMRSTRVVGGCSQDSRPREHAINMALLSAETYNWEVFLKSHLDIMNDRFDRVSDGSYAWRQRNTYIRELEELNINVTDLILGISFRIENPASNHYFGSIGRVGRALSETKNRDEIENAMLAIIADTELDYFNRLLFYFLFKNYNYHIEDETIKKVSNEKLVAAVATLPDYFSNQLTDK
ncbi:hypothetical protein [Flavobacterium orientale]|uniref:Uncharacterized protein n=1 Tax=Flavobacterium orientale TaxID=1756020 RepID=A0A916Y4V8_9FLAO|nr:hypothetical protein [Flavobacterium orientale]GGD30642.1 hypothetical protein GCM10011343_21000 [Flavobacterium orientale]